MDQERHELSLTQLWEELLFRLSKPWPALYDSLEPGATETTIRSMERGFGTNFPPELREFFTLQQGQNSDAPSGLFYHWYLLGFRDLLKLWQELGAGKSDEEPQVEGPIQPVWAHRFWIPLATDYAGGLLCSDLAPAPGGQRGQLIEVGLEYPLRRVVAPSLTAYLQMLLDDLESEAWCPDDWLWEPLVLRVPLENNDSVLEQFGLSLALQSEGRELWLDGWGRCSRWDESSFVEVVDGNTRLRPRSASWPRRGSLRLRFAEPLSTSATIRVGFSRRT